MKLGELYYKIYDRIRRIVYIFRYNPFTEQGRRSIALELERQGIRRAQNIEIGDSLNLQSQQNSSYTVDRSSTAQQPATTPFTPTQLNHRNTAATVSPYQEYRCISNNPLVCYKLQQTLEKALKAQFCSQCGFPVPLLEKQQIRGNRGTYQIKRILGKRGLGRLYTAIQENDDRPVEIKEYLLPNLSFSDPEVVRQRQEAFLRLANIRSADGKISDFRLLFPTEGIVDRQKKRCYLIFRGNLASLPTLSNYLAERGAMRDEQAIALLEQNLQSLEYLHGAKFKYSTGQLQTGSIHGNISLNSILIDLKETGFFAYLCDFSSIEELFEPAKLQTTSKTIAKDLQDLGAVGFYALTGQTPEPSRDRKLYPQEYDWPSVDRNLKHFILRLLAIDTPFENASTARVALRNLSVKHKAPTNDLTEESDELPKESKKKLRTPLILLVCLAIFLGLGSLLYSLFRGSNPSPEVSNENFIEVKNIKDTKDIKDLDQGDFTFTTVESGVSNYAFLRKLLQAGQSNLVEEIESRDLKEIKFQHDPSANKKEAIEKIQNPEDTQFAIVSSFDEIDEAQGKLNFNKIAYDSLVVIVPYTSQKRPDSLATPLNGKITIEQLRKLYTGEITNWEYLQGPNREVKLFIPDNDEAIRLFEEKILKKNNAIDDFQRLLQEGKITKLTTFEMVRQLKQNFESDSKIGGIGLGFLSQSFGQCGVYPLAIEKDDRTIQTIIENKTDKPITPKTADLCAKGGYRVDLQVFHEKKYPLTFDISILYQGKDGKKPKYQIGPKFAEMLSTEEGQCLLKEVFLVPAKVVTKADCSQYKDN